jgi:hypothetical protein
MGNPYLGLQRIKIILNGYQVQDDVKDSSEEKRKRVDPVRYTDEPNELNE